MIQGPWLMEEMKGQAKAVGTEMIQDHISKVDLKQKPFVAMAIAANYILRIVSLYQLGLRQDGLI